MVALIQPTPARRESYNPTNRTPSSRQALPRPLLVGLPGGDDGRSGDDCLEARVRSVPGRLVIALSVIVGLYLALSLIQGGPPSLAEQSSAASAASLPAQLELGETVLIAEPGDTYWGIARDLVGADEARSAVERLVARNGGADLQIGQEVVVPASFE